LLGLASCENFSTLVCFWLTQKHSRSSHKLKHTQTYSSLIVSLNHLCFPRVWLVLTRMCKNLFLSCVCVCVCRIVRVMGGNRCSNSSPPTPSTPTISLQRSENLMTSTTLSHSLSPQTPTSNPCTTRNLPCCCVISCLSTSNHQQNPTVSRLTLHTHLYEYRFSLLSLFPLWSCCFQCLSFFPLQYIILIYPPPQISTAFSFSSKNVPPIMQTFYQRSGLSCLMRENRHRHTLVWLVDCIQLPFNALQVIRWCFLFLLKFFKFN